MNQEQYCVSQSKNSRLYDSSESEFKIYSLIKDDVDWIIDEQNDTREMILKLYVK